MRLKLNILVFTLLALLSCAKESGECVRDDQGTGTLYVRFDVPANAGVTKVDGVSGGGYDGTHNVLEKDNIIQHGRLFLVDNDGTVVAYRKASDNKDNKDGVIENSSRTEVITGIKRGNYKLYVFVNGSKEQAEIFDKAYPNPHKLSINDLLKTKLSDHDLVGGNSPSFTKDEGIPCTFVTDVAITAGNNYVDAHLERCVGRLTIKVLNNIPDRKLAIRSIGLSADNPTNGYYFPSSSAVTKGAFPELEGVVEFALNENKTIFDHYVYETDVVAEGLSFDLFGAVYGSTANVGFEENKAHVYKFDKNITSDWNPNDGEIYLLRSAASPDYYIGDLDGNGKLGCGANSDDIVFGHKSDVKNYLWKVSVNDSEKKYKFKNVGTNNFIKLNRADLSLVDKEDEGTEFSTSSSQDGCCFYDYQWTLGVPARSNYYIAYKSDNNTLFGSTTNDDNTKWILRKVEPFNEGGFINSEADIPRKKRLIKHVDKYGDAQLLQQIKRNEHVTVSINIFYNMELGQFDFEVSSWKEISNETTFD